MKLTLLSILVELSLEEAEEEKVELEAQEVQEVMVELVDQVGQVVLVRQELPLSLVLTEVVQVEDLVALVDQEEVEQWARDRSLDTGAVLAILAASIPRHPVEVGAFLMDQFPVTEGEYRTFVLGEGYEEPSHWSDGFPQSRAQWPAWKSWKSRPRSIGSCTGLITKS